MNVLQSSPTVALIQKVATLRNQGISVLSFAAGEPDFSTPQIIQDAAKKALDDGYTRYTPAAGLLSLRQAIVHKLQQENNLKYDISQIMTSGGAKQILFMLFQVLLDPGDEVIIPSPFWTTYADQVAFSQGHVKEVDTTPQHYIFTAEAFEKAITPRTKAVIINSPSNPTGAVIPQDELQKIGALAVEHNIWIISDEVYEYFSYETPVVSIASLSSYIYKKTLTINAVSKSFAMTGWRLGYIAGDAEIIQAMITLQSQLSSHPSSISQIAAEKALLIGKSISQEMYNAFVDRSHYVYNAFSHNSIMRIYNIPQGAFYAWIDVRKLCALRNCNVEELCHMLLEKYHVAVVPGSVFGSYGEGFIRFSFASSMEDIQEGIKRILQAF